MGTDSTFMFGRYYLSPNRAYSRQPAGAPAMPDEPLISTPQSGTSAQRADLAQALILRVQPALYSTWFAGMPAEQQLKDTTFLLQLLFAIADGNAIVIVPSDFAKWYLQRWARWPELEEYIGYDANVRYTDAAQPRSTNRYTEPHPDYGTLMTVAEFREAVAVGNLRDYDGFGNPSNGTHADPTIGIYPSGAMSIPADATHILWYNR